VITFVNIMHGTVVSEVVATGTPLLQGPAHGYACLMQILNAHLVRLFLNLFDKALYVMTTHVRSIMSVVILVLSDKNLPSFYKFNNFQNDSIFLSR